MPAKLVLQQLRGGKHALGFNPTSQNTLTVNDVIGILPILIRYGIIKAGTDETTFLTAIKTQLLIIPQEEGIPEETRGQFLHHISIPENINLQRLITDLKSAGITVEMSNTLRAALTSSRSARRAPPPPPPPQRPDVTTSGDGRLKMYATNITVIQMNTVWAQHLRESGDAGVVVAHNHDLLAALLDSQTQFKSETLKKLHAAIQKASTNGSISFIKLAEGGVYNIRTNNGSLLFALTNLELAGSLPKPPPPPPVHATRFREPTPPPPPPPRKSRGLIGRFLGMFLRDSSDASARTSSSTAQRPPRTAPNQPPRPPDLEAARIAAAARRAGAAPTSPTPPPQPRVPNQLPPLPIGDQQSDFYDPIGMQNLCGFAALSHAVDQIHALLISGQIQKVGRDDSQQNYFLRKYIENYHDLKTGRLKDKSEEYIRAMAMKLAFLDLIRYDKGDDNPFNNLMGDAILQKIRPDYETNTPDFLKYKGYYGEPDPFRAKIAADNLDALKSAYKQYLVYLGGPSNPNYARNMGSPSAFMQYLREQDPILYQKMLNAYSKEVKNTGYAAHYEDMKYMAVNLSNYFDGFSVSYLARQNTGRLGRPAYRYEMMEFGQVPPNAKRPLRLMNGGREQAEHQAGQAPAVNHWRVANIRMPTLQAQRQAAASAPPSHPTFSRPAPGASAAVPGPTPPRGGVPLPGMRGSQPPAPPPSRQPGGAGPPAPPSRPVPPTAPPPLPPSRPVGGRPVTPTTAMTPHMPTTGSTGQPTPPKRGGLLSTLFGPGKQGGTPQSGSPSAPPRDDPNARKKPKKR